MEKIGNIFPWIEDGMAYKLEKGEFMRYVVLDCMNCGNEIELFVDTIYGEKPEVYELHECPDDMAKKLVGREATCECGATIEIVPTLSTIITLPDEKLDNVLLAYKNGDVTLNEVKEYLELEY